MDSYVIGVDEVGRGCVWGPLVVAGAVRLNSWHHDQVTDSKALTPTQRERLAPLIRQNMRVELDWISAAEINQHGISWGLREAQHHVITALIHAIRAGNRTHPIRVILDGNDLPDQQRIFLSCLVQYPEPEARIVTYEARPKADATVFECSAASIVAKVERDRAVMNHAAQHPELDPYDLITNKGYGVAPHRDAIMAHGLTVHHRTQFCDSLVRNYLEKQQRGAPTTPPAFPPAPPSPHAAPSAVA